VTAPRVHLSPAELHELARASLAAIGVEPSDLDAVVEHTVAAELRGSDGLQRIVSLAASIDALGPPRGEIAIRRETAVTASLDGANRLGFVVAERATSLVIEKASVAGLALVTANEHRYSGALAHYVDRVARAGLVGLAWSVGAPMVAPYGGARPRMSTNPIAFGFPGSPEPVVVDLSTAAVSGIALGRLADEKVRLEPGSALDKEGRATTDPAAALDGGTVLAWGGHRGSALSIAIQLLGLLADIEPMPAVDGDGWAFAILAIDPGALLPGREYETRVAAFAEAVRATPPEEGFDAVRMPYDRALAERRVRSVEGVDVPEGLHRRLTEIAEGAR
jgi:LDH2 family malate/lactate/ureidoglycolate dehydrogenase